MFDLILKELGCSSLALQIAAMKILESDHVKEVSFSDELSDHLEKINTWINPLPEICRKSLAWEILSCDSD